MLSILSSASSIAEFGNQKPRLSVLATYQSVPNLVFLYMFNSADFGTGFATSQIQSLTGTNVTVADSSSNNKPLYVNNRNATWSIGSGMNTNFSASIQHTGNVRSSNLDSLYRSSANTPSSANVPANANGQYSFGFWFQMNAKPSEFMFFSMAQSNTNPRVFAFYGTIGQKGIHISLNGSNFLYTVPDASISLNTWYHFSFAGSATRVDWWFHSATGTLISSGNNNGLPVANTSNAFTQVGIMCDPYNNFNGASGFTMTGRMQALFYCSGILTSQQITNLVTRAITI